MRKRLVKIRLIRHKCKLFQMKDLIIELYCSKGSKHSCSKLFVGNFSIRSTYMLISCNTGGFPRLATKIFTVSVSSTHVSSGMAETRIHQNRMNISIVISKSFC